MSRRVPTTTVAAVDLGASSGRVMLGHFDSGRLRLETVRRFDNVPMPAHDGLHWNIGRLYRGVLTGLREAAARCRLRSVAVDSWAVDYALLRDGRMLAPPFHHRDTRNTAAAEAVHRIVPFEQLYQCNGLQYLPFNTIYQLYADAAGEVLAAADRLLLIPDLIGYRLSGVAVAERTNASTTGLIDIHTGGWNRELLARLGIPDGPLGELVEPGTSLGPVRPELGLGAAELVTVGSHDTASAVVAVPAADSDVAYISCGTWSLVGVELAEPVLSDAARAANFTNEAGVDGRTRFLRNVSGLWLLNESLRTWRQAGERFDLATLLDEAATLDSRHGTVFDVEDPVFLPPGDMPARIEQWFREHDRRPPTRPAQLVRSILESLAVAYAQAVRQASALSGKPVTTVHIVGGGSQNELLCQLTADRLGLPVSAGPVEATAIGNMLIQGRSHGIINGTLEALRTTVTASMTPMSYRPRSGR